MASLVGGLAISVGVFILWLLVAGEIAGKTPGLFVVALGLLVAGGIGLWVRLADL
ncbi:MAG: hypothetical protein JO264_02290 [Acidisphaera sp.]|nr:hypothetical protein [Acidisphaera sp.]